MAGRRDYENEGATEAVADHCPEPVVRALVVGPPGSHEATMGGALRSLFGGRKRRAGLHHRNVLVLTPTSVRLFSCAATGYPPPVDEEVGAWAVRDVRIEASAAQKDSIRSTGNTIHAKYYRIALTVPGGSGPVELECVRSDSARTTIQALEDATGSPPSKVTARRRKRAAS